MGDYLSSQLAVHSWKWQTKIFRIMGTCCIHSRTEATSDLKIASVIYPLSAVLEIFPNSPVFGWMMRQERTDTFSKNMLVLHGTLIENYKWYIIIATIGTE